MEVSPAGESKLLFVALVCIASFPGRTEWPGNEATLCTAVDM